MKNTPYYLHYLQARVFEIIFLCFGFFCILPGCKTHAVSSPLNILLITIDDLRPELGCYGAEYIHSPNIDRIANEGFRYERAYCSMSWCAPSRTSLMTGLRPGTTGVRDLQTHFRTTLPQAITLPQYFKQSGYTSLGFGKLYHNDPAMQDSLSWTRKCWIPPGKNPILAYASKENLLLASLSPYQKASATESANVPDEAYPDGQVTLEAMAALHELQESDVPFFLGVGYYKPHLPFAAPSKYWDLYERENIPLPTNRDFPQGGSSLMFRTWSEPGSYSDIDLREPYPDTLARRLKHGYAACVSYIDAQVGMLMNELENLGLLENTIVVIWGDHGWKLGEYGRWSKHSNMEIDTRVPLIIRIPGQEPQVIKSIVETIDLYPTLVGLAGLEVPESLEGEDLLHKSRDFALSQITRDSIIGFAVRTAEFRFIEWEKTNESESPLAIELYDHRSSDNELINLASDTAYSDTIAKLRNKLYGPEKIILDTDMGSDCDDVGALALLHQYASERKAEILGVVYSSGAVPYGAGVVDAINAYYGRSDIPIGASYDEHFGDPVDKMYAEKLARNPSSFGNRIIKNTDTDEQTVLNRRLLAGAPDQSITYITIGHTKGLYDLLISSPDSISALSGNELVSRKIKKWVALGALGASNTEGKLSRDWNFFFNGTAEYTKYLVDNFPGPVYFVDAGNSVMTGKSLVNTPEGNIVRTAYESWLWNVEGKTLKDQRPSWDLATVQYAIEGPNPFFEPLDKGYLEFDPDIGCRWVFCDSITNQHFIKQRSGTDQELSDYLNDRVSKSGHSESN